MASEHNFQESESYFGTDGDLLLRQKWNFSSPTMATENTDGCFECNICLDSAQDPVVTLCGHLYCWPCIYEWLNVQNSSLDQDQQQQQNCPVCKANISYNSLVPLYGRGASSGSKSKNSHLDIAIPRRPLPLGANNSVSSSPSSMSHPSQQFHPNLFQSQSQSFHHHEFFSHPYGGYAATESSPRDITTTSILNPYGEMVYARIFGSSDPSLFAYPHASSYPFMGSSSNPRIRRQEMQLDKSLNRVSIFLFCCFILCLLLF